MAGMSSCARWKACKRKAWRNSNWLGTGNVSNAWTPPLAGMPGLGVARGPWRPVRAIRRSLVLVDQATRLALDQRACAIAK